MFGTLPALGVILIAGPAALGTLHGNEAGTYEIPPTYLVPLVCPDGVGGLRGGPACMKKAAKRTEVRVGEHTIKVKKAKPSPCGIATPGFAIAAPGAGFAPRTLAVWGGGEVGMTPTGDPALPLQLDLDGDGTLETVAVSLDLESDEPTRVRLQITGGEVTTTHDPFGAAWDIAVIATSDVDADGQRELILWASLTAGHAVAVLEYGAPDATYVFRCEAT
jgi:hypothetical protein